MKKMIYKGFELIRNIESIPDIGMKIIKESNLPPLFLKYISLFEIGDNYINVPISSFICEKDSSYMRQYAGLIYFDNESLNGIEIDHEISSLYTYDELLDEYNRFLNKEEEWHRKGFMKFGYFGFGSDILLIGIENNVRDEIWRRGVDFSNLYDKLASDIFDLMSKIKLFVCEDDLEETCGEELEECDVDVSDFYRIYGEDFWRIKGEKTFVSNYYIEMNDFLLSRKGLQLLFPLVSMFDKSDNDKNVLFIPPLFKKYLNIFEVGTNFIFKEYILIDENKLIKKDFIRSINYINTKEIEFIEVKEIFTFERLYIEFKKYKNSQIRKYGFIRIGILKSPEMFLQIGIGLENLDEIWISKGDKLLFKIANDIFDLNSKLRQFLDYKLLDEINVKLKDLYQNWGENFWRVRE